MSDPRDIAASLLEDAEDPKDYAMRLPVYFVITWRNDAGTPYYWQNFNGWQKHLRNASRFSTSQIAHKHWKQIKDATRWPVPEIRIEPIF